MHSMINLVLFGFSNSVMADTVKDAKPWSLGSYMGSVSEIEGADTIVEAPIYRHQNGLNNDVFVVATTSGEDDAKPWMFSLSMSDHVIWVNKAFVRANKLKIQTTNKRLIPYPSDYYTGGELKYVVIPELNIAGMKLKNITAFLNSSKGNFGAVKMMNRHSVSLRIGLGAIPQLSYAILNSVGKIKFVKAEKGSELLSAVGGSELNYETKGWREVKFGKTQKISAARSLIVKVKIGETSSNTALDIVDGSAAAWSLPLNKVQRQYGDMKMDWQNATIGDHSVNGWLPRIGDFSRGHLEFDGFLGHGFTRNFDIAVDQQQYKVGLKRILNSQSQQAHKALLPQAQAKLAKASEKGKGEKGTEKKNSSNAKELKRVRFLAEKSKSWKLALQTAKQLTEVEGESCDHWMKLGSLQRNVGEFDKAFESYEQASKLFHHWWDRDIGERMDIKKAQAEISDAKSIKEEAKKAPLAKDAKWIFSQPEQCHKVDGQLASLALAKGKHDKVEEMYRSKLDLDPGLAMAFGNSALVTGQIQKAHEAYRQALKMEASPKSVHRLGLAMAFADQGEWRFAEPLFEEALKLNPEDSVALNLWLDNKRGENAQENLNRAKGWLDNNPDSAVAHFAYAREAIQSQATNKDAIIKSVGAFFERSATNQPNSESVAAHVQFLVLINALGEAEALLAKHGETTAHPHLLLAKAELQLKRNNKEGAKQTLLNSVTQWAQHPGYALFLRSL